MDESFERSFGIIIAYIVPGFVCMAGASQYSETVAGWMSVAPASGPSIGSFLYVILGSLAAGLMCNCFRFVALDSLYQRTGLVAPRLDFRKLQKNIDAFQLTVEHNFRYYQHHGSMLIAILFFAAADQCAKGVWSASMLIGLTVVETMLFVTARDNLRRFYDRTNQLLGTETITTD